MASGYILRCSVRKRELSELLHKDTPQEIHSLQKLASLVIITEIGYDFKDKELFAAKLDTTQLTKLAQEFVQSCLY